MLILPVGIEEVYCVYLKYDALKFTKEAFKYKVPISTQLLFSDRGKEIF